MANGLLLVGTLKLNWVGVPHTLKDVKQIDKCADRGTMRYEHIDEIVSVQWKERWTVTQLSTISKANLSREIERNTKVNGHHVVLQIRQPECIGRYNAHMDVADVFNQWIAANRSLRKTNKYWKTIVVDIIDAVTVNCNILFNLHRRMNEERIQHPSNYEAADFRQELICELVGIPNDDLVVLVYKPTPQQHDNPPPPGPHLVRFTETERSCKRCSRVESGQRKCQTMCVTYMYLHTNHRNCFYLHQNPHQ